MLPLWSIAAAALLTGSLPAQLEGAERVARAQPPAGEVPIDEVLASLELEGDHAPQFALRSAYVLLLRAELLARRAPDALHTPVDPSVSESFLEQLMGELLVVREAERAGEVNVSPSALAEERTRLVTAMHGEAALPELLAATGATPADFDALVRRRVVTLRYLVAHLPRLIEPSEQDLRQAYESDRYRWYREHGSAFAEARRAIRADLVRASLPGVVRQYLRSLGSRVRARVFADAAPAEAPATSQATPQATSQATSQATPRAAP